MALFGSPLEKEIKRLASDGEPAWRGAGKQIGVEVWRIEKFQIKAWPKERFAQVYNGDSYIFLHTYEKNNVRKWHAHFWLGTYTSQDEAGTAAYKTVELDDHLGGVPVLYREVQGSESHSFLKLFPHGLKVLNGGVESGFHHHAPDHHEPRLLHVHGHINHTIVRNVPLKVSSLSEGDVFILDLGKTLYQFNGSHAGIGAKSTGAKLSRSIDDERGGCHVTVIASSDDEDAFWSHLGGKGRVRSAEEAKNDVDENEKKAMFKISDRTGKLTITAVPVSKASFTVDEVFVFDSISTIWVWVGRSADAEERKNGLLYASKYLHNHSNRPVSTPIVRIVEGGENDEFDVDLTT